MNPSENWRPATTLTLLKNRARLLQDIRDFFSSRNVLEVETPLISLAGNTDPQIESIRTDAGAYLRTSPEFALKRLLAAGSGDIFELGRVFRAGESGYSHNPEFTMLEWYRVGFSYHELMDEVAKLVRFCGHGKFDHWSNDRLSYKQLFQRHLGIDPHTADVSTLANIAKKHGLCDIVLDRRQWLDLLISLVIQPAMPGECLTFVYDFPADQAALARIRPESPRLAERFELYLGSTELANGYQELTDPIEQLQRIDSENNQRKERGQELCEVDNHLIAALQHGMPECAGVALGVDRFLMNICEIDTIDEVIAFPYPRA